MLNVEDQLHKFRLFPQIFNAHPCCKLEVLYEDVYVLHPNSRCNSKFNKKYPLSLFALTHGNETAGLAVVNEILTLIAHNILRPEISIVFALGNVPAALANKRFLQEDLNRCYGGNGKNESNSSLSGERKRSKILEEILQETAYLLDFHQTQTLCESSFFVTVKTRSCLDFISGLDPHAVVVASEIGEVPLERQKQRHTATRYIYAHGGVGVTLELGEMGLHENQIARGIHMGINAFSTATTLLSPTTHKINPHLTSKYSGKYFEVAHKITTEEINNIRLDEKWQNFTYIKKGDVLGISEGTTLQAPEDGYILFPKFQHGQRVVMVDAGEPLCLILRQTDFPF